MFKKYVEAEIEDVVPNSGFGLCLCSCCCIVNFVIIILFFPCTLTQLGQFKIGLIRNKVTGFVDLERPFEPGMYWIGFWKDFVEFPSTIQTIEFSNEKPEEGVLHMEVLKARDKDGKQVFLDISIQYQLAPENLGKIYKEMLLGYEDIFISELRDQFAKAANLFAIQDAWLNYKSVVELMRVRCEAVLQKRFAKCWGLQLWGVGLTKRYETKLIKTQVKTQAQKTALAEKVQAEVRATTQVLMAEYKKNVTILRSSGTAEKYMIEQLAYATAQANIISAQAKAVQIVKDNVCQKDGRVIGAGSTTCLSDKAMSGTHLTSYQKQVLLKASGASHFVYDAEGKPPHRSAINVEAARNIIAGKARRRLLHDDGFDQDADTRKLLDLDLGDSDAMSSHRDPRQLLLQAEREGEAPGLHEL